VLVLEHLKGPTLAEFFAERRTPLKFVQQTMPDGKTKTLVTGGTWAPQKKCIYCWSMQLLSALVYMHDRGIVHSDLSTDTVLLSGWGLRVPGSGFRVPGFGFGSLGVVV
jgi:serine/threonine protein kinase